MPKKWIVLLVSVLFMLTACHSPMYNQTENNVADVKISASQALQKSDNDAKRSPALTIKNGMYVDTTPHSLGHDPSWFCNHIVIRGDQLPFSYYSRTIAAGAGAGILTKYQTGLDPSISLSMNYSGSIKGALDLIASKTGYAYTLKGNSIYWQAYVTRTYDIAFMPGGTDYLMGKTNSGSGSGTNTASGTSSGTTSNYTTSDSSDSEYSNLKGTLSVWKDLDTTIRQLLSADGRVIVSESTTSVTVRDKPMNVELIGQYIRNLNSSLSKQVLVKVQVIDVQLDSSFDYGINWSTVNNAFHNSPFRINANYGTPISLTALNPSGGTVPTFGTQIANSSIIPGYTILVNALNQQGKTSIVTEPRVVCLNNQVSVVRIVETNGYVASVQNTSLAGSGSTTAALSTVTSQVTPGTLITGLTLYILPKILKENIYLQVNADLSINQGFTTFNSATGTASPSDASSTSGSTFIQLPNVNEKHFNQRSVIHSGDTLILAGFRQLGNQAGANQMFNSQALGGTASAQSNSETIVLITPYVLNGSA